MKFKILLIIIFSFSINFEYIASNIDLNLSLYEFQSKLLPRIIFNNESYKNIVLSPVSIFQIISLLANGALGVSQKQIVFFLKANNLVELNVQNSKINQILTFNNNNLISVNGIFTKSPPKKEIIEIGYYKYNATITQLNSVDKINKWCYEQTNNKIKKIIDSIDNTLILLISVSYFRDYWKYPFSPLLTTKEIFNGKVTVDMMHQIYDLVNYYENSEVQIIELPFKDSKYNALIILPNEYYAKHFVGFTVTAGLEYMKINQDEMSLEKVHLALPKFEINFDIILNKAVEALGMVAPFYPVISNFKNLSEEMDLYLSTFKHKSILHINEYGLNIDSNFETSKKTNLKKENCKEMTVNRPFLFIVRDRNLEEASIFFAKIEHL